MSQHDLFRWERISRPRTRVYSRSQRVTTNNEVQDWIKTVEEASTRALDATFGTQHSRHHGRKQAVTAVQDVRNLDAAYTEAQDLLQEWVRDKMDFNDMEFSEEPWSKPKSQLDVQKEWDRLVEANADPCLDYLQANINGSGDHVLAVQASAADEDDNRTVESILQKMLNKDLIKEDFIKDLGLDDRHRSKDPTTKMKLRHEQVKANREKRTKIKQQKLQELQEKKDAQFKARHIVMKEEQQKTACFKREEVEIQRQMALIRKQMGEEKREAEELQLKQKKDQLEMEKWAGVQLASEQATELEEEQRAASQIEQRQCALLMRMHEIESQETKQNLKVLRRYFSTWYKVVIERQIQAGKARAVSDWKLMLRTYTAWRAYTRGRRVQNETRKHEANMRDDHCKWLLAERHHRGNMLRRYFVTWHVNVAQQQSEHTIALAQNSTKSKMAALLEAAASGRLRSARSSEMTERRADSVQTDRQVDELFDDTMKPKVKTGLLTSRSISSDPASVDRQGDVSRKRVQIPQEPWQVTRRHAQLTTGQLRSACRTASQPVTTPVTGPVMTPNVQSPTGRPRVPAPPPDTFKHRHDTQQKILQTQQTQLREQQRLIDDLQYLQRQQLLQQQLVQQQLISEHLDRDGSACRMSPMESHLSNVQKAVVNVDTDCVQPMKDSLPPTGRSEVTLLIDAMSEVTFGVTPKETPKPVEVENAARSASCESKQTSSRHTNFLCAMEDRAVERARMKRDREERKRKTELERHERLAAEAAEVLRLDDQIKLQKRHAHREKRRLEGRRELERKAEQEHMDELERRAREHHARSVLKYRGWKPWQRLVEMAREADVKATQLHTESLLRKHFQLWQQTVHGELEVKRHKADKLYCQILLRRCFENWKRCGEYMAIQEGRAKRMHQRKVKLRVFQAWADHAADERVAMWHKEQKAKEHNYWRMQRNALLAWKRFPAFLQEEEQKEKRREEMRKKVAAMLPDFQASAPNRSVDIL